jgi:hypothetical protein
MKTKMFYLAAILFAIGLGSCSNSDNEDNSASQEGITFKVEEINVTTDDFNALLYNNLVAVGRYIDVFKQVGENRVAKFHFSAKTGGFSAQQSFDMKSSWLM